MARRRVGLSWRWSGETRRLHVVVVALVAGLTGSATPAGAVAQGGGANLVVIATSTADGSSTTRSGVQLASVGGETVESTNLAIASSRDCSGCRAVAVAVESIFITRDPSTVSPTNAAVATNENCNSCASFAYAYQYVLSTGGPVFLSGDARTRIVELRAEIAEVSASGLPFDQLTARLDELTAEFRSIIDQELARAGIPTDGAVVREHVTQSPAA